MKKITLFLIALFTAILANAETKTITQDFNDCEWGALYDKTKVTNDYLPTGWYLQNPNAIHYCSISKTAGVNGTQCLYITGAGSDGVTLVTKAYGSPEGGKISMDLKKIGTSWMYHPRAYIYKMTDNGDGTFTQGELICQFDEDYLNNTLSTSEFTTVSYDEFTDEECLIGLYFTYVYFDNYVNEFSSGEATETYTVSGSVKSGENAIVDATVSLLGKGSYTATTDENGNFSIADVEAGEYTLTISAAGYQKYEQSVTVTDGDVDISTVEINLTESVLKATVKSYETYNGIAEANVSLYDGDNLITTGTTQMDGTCSLTVYGSLAEKYTVKVSHRLYADKETSNVILTAGGEKELTIYMDEKELIFDASVKNSSGELIRNATVNVTRNATGQQSSATDLADYYGVYRYKIAVKDMGEDETFTVNITADGYTSPEPYTFSFDDEDKTEEFVLYKPTTISGVVSDESGNAVSDAEVTLYDGNSSEVAKTTTDAYGAYTLSIGQPEGSYKLTATATYYDETELEIGELEAETSVEQNITLTLTERTLTVRVVNSTNDPIVGATVTFVRAGEGFAPVTLTGNEEGIYTYVITEKELGDNQEFTVNATAEGYIAAAPQTSGFYGEDVELPFVLYKPTTISGVVNDENDGPKAGATVVLSDDSGTEIGTVTTGEDGTYSFSIEGMPAESYKLTVTAQYYKKATATVTPEREEALTKDFTLKLKVLSFSATVIYENYMPVDDATVTMSDGTTTVNVELESTAVYAFYITEREADGKEYTLTISKEGYKTIVHTFSFEGFDESEMFVLESITDGIANVKTAGKSMEIVDGKLYVSGNATIYDLNGRLVKKVGAAEGKTKVDLSAGCYIVNGKKVVVR